MSILTDFLHFLYEKIIIQIALLMTKLEKPEKFAGKSPQEAVARIATIGNLPGSGSVYQRYDGRIFFKLDQRFHVQVRTDYTKPFWIGEGCKEEFDPNEEVWII